MHAHQILTCGEALFQNGLISHSSRDGYAFAEPIAFQQGAIVHAYKLIAGLFTGVFKRGGHSAAKTTVKHLPNPFQ